MVKCHNLFGTRKLFGQPVDDSEGVGLWFRRKAEHDFLRVRNKLVVAVDEVEVEAVAHLVVDLARQRDAAAVGDALDAGGNLLVRVQKAEEEAVLSIQPQTGIVIATGGSAIYSQSAMIWLKSFSLLFFLNDSLEGLEKRISNMTTRGIVGLKGSFKDLYIERYPLYMEYADEVIEVSPFNKAQIIARIIDLIEYEIQ